MPVATSPDRIAAVLEDRAAHPDQPLSNIANRALLDRDSVRRLIDKQVPVVSELASLKRDEMLAGWQWMYLDTLVKVQDTPDLSFKDRQSAAITMGIASEKTLLLSGHPTQLVGHLHEVRVSLPEIASRLAEVGKALKRPQPMVVEMDSQAP